MKHAPAIPTQVMVIWVTLTHRRELGVRLAAILHHQWPADRYAARSVPIMRRDCLAWINECGPTDTTAQCAVCEMPLLGQPQPYWSIRRADFVGPDTGLVMARTYCFMGGQHCANPACVAWLRGCIRSLVRATVEQILASDHVRWASEQQCLRCAKWQKAGAPKYLLCGRCCFGYYCSVKCQRAHWTKHKQTCHDALPVLAQAQADHSPEPG